ncbi:MAG: hypothetical protein R2939_15250 [Kofleriaceae bacterium]
MPLPVSVRELWRAAAWAPDAVREAIVAQLADAAARDDLIERAQLAEILARVFAVTAAWELATLAYAHAAAAWDEAGDALRGATLRSIARTFPLAPLATDAEAVAAERELVRRVLVDDAPPLVRRAVLDLRRRWRRGGSPAPSRRPSAWRPEQVALLMAACASVLDDASGPPRPATAWAAQLGPSLRAELDDLDRLVELGLCRATPNLVPHPAVVSRLLGRTALEHLPGARLVTVDDDRRATAPAGTAARLALGEMTLIVGGDRAGRRRIVAAIAGQRGQPALVAEPGPGARLATLVDAGREARLHGAVLAVELDAWRAAGVELDDAAATDAVRAAGPVLLAEAPPRQLGLELRALAVTAGAVE